MTATTLPRLTDVFGRTPARGTYPVAANELILKGTIVCLDASGNAVEGVDGEGLDAVGIASSTADNRTTAPEGGGAGAINIEVEFGVFKLAETGTDPVIGDVVYVVDNQTISTDSDSSARGVAGLCVDVKDSEFYIWVGPHVARLLKNAELETDATSAQHYIPVPVNSFADDGGPLVAFNDGVANGIALVDSEYQGFRFNPVGEDTSTLSATVPMPPDLDATADVVVHLLGCRVGSADTTAVLDVGAFFHSVGAAHTADADCGGSTAALAEATTIVAEKTVTIAAADVPAAPCDLTLTIAPDSALDADDYVLGSVWIEYTRALLTS